MEREIKYCKRIQAELQYVVFPDNAIDQSEISNWINKSGGKASLYNGASEMNVKTSTDCTWRWKFVSLDDGHANIGDYIVKDIGGRFLVFTPKQFKENFNIHQDSK